MFIINTKYPLHYFKGDFENLVAVPHEVHYQNEDGQIYLQFYEGQLIPKEIYNNVFNNENKVVDEIEVAVKEIVTTSESEVKEEIEITEKTEEVEIEKIENDVEVDEVVTKQPAPTKTKGRSKK